MSEPVCRCGHEAGDHGRAGCAAREITAEHGDVSCECHRFVSEEDGSRWAW